MKEIIHFSHANGFPAGCYRQLFSALNDHNYDVHASDILGHDKNFPVTDNWTHLVQELIQHLQVQHRRPVIAVGHSFGGILQLMAATQRPDLFKALVLLDSPVFSTIETTFIALAKRLRLIDYITPAARTNGRKAIWESREEAIEYFSGKTLMKRFQRQCLEDYVDYGTQVTARGLELVFQPATEMKIYRTVPHNLSRSALPASLPASVIAGRSSKVFRAMNAAHMKHRLGMRVKWTEGSHMFPFEDPQRTAGLINEEITNMLLRGRRPV